METPSPLAPLLLLLLWLLSPSALIAAAPEPAFSTLTVLSADTFCCLADEEEAALEEEEVAEVEVEVAVASAGRLLLLLRDVLTMRDGSIPSRS